MRRRKIRKIEKNRNILIISKRSKILRLKRVNLRTRKRRLQKTKVQQSQKMKRSLEKHLLRKRNQKSTMKIKFSRNKAHLLLWKKSLTKPLIKKKRSMRV